MTSEISCSGELHAGQIIALHGPSGVGKTSVLRMLAGLLKPDEGYIKSGETEWFGPNVNLFPKDRKVGFVYQEYNLFPNMTIEGNLRFADPNGGISNEIKELLKYFGVGEILPLYPYQLSGGQRQRVAILRAIAQRPEFLFLDEPFSALDDETSKQVIQQLQKLDDVAILLVSHRKDIILSCADQVIVMDQAASASKQGVPEDFLSVTF